jgi:hypothetical protein
MSVRLGLGPNVVFDWYGHHVESIEFASWEQAFEVRKAVCIGYCGI